MALLRRLHQQTEDPPAPPTPAPAEPSTTPSPLPPLNTIADCNAAIMQIDQQRVAAMEVVNGELAAEEVLLEADAPDQEFARLTMRVRAARRLLVKLDRQEWQIIDAAEKLDGELRQQQWDDYRASYIADALELRDLAVRTAQLRDRIRNTSATAHRGGFGDTSAPALPIDNVAIPLQVLLLYHEWAGQTPAMAPPRSGRSAGRGVNLGPVLGVRFIKPFERFAIGATCDFPESRARWLVEAGFGEPYEYNVWGSPPSPEVLRRNGVPQ